MTDAITTTLARIRAAGPCEDGYKKLCKSLGGIEAYGKDTPITFRQIYESNGYDDTLWCLQTVDRRHDAALRHFAVDCAEQVRHLMTDPRSLAALDVARRYADGLATDDELTAARAAAGDAAWDAAWAAARATARAAGDAAWDAARDAARAAAGDAAWAVARAAQMQLLFEYCRTGKRVMNPDRFLGSSK